MAGIREATDGNVSMDDGVAAKSFIHQSSKILYIWTESSAQDLVAIPVENFNAISPGDSDHKH